MTTRHDDWPDRLAAFLEARRRAPFAWGTNDCVTFAADGVQQLRRDSVDIIAADRGAWATEDEAEALLASRGGLETALAELAAMADLQEVPPPRAGRGDLVLARVGNQVLTGLVNGSTVAVTGADGLQFVPARMAFRAWRV